MKITRFTDYSLRVLIFLAIKETRSSIAEVSKTFGLPVNHIMKVVHKLGQLGHIQTSRGKTGGIRIARPLEEINIGVLVEQLEPGLEMEECFGRDKNVCRITNSCKVKGFFHEATAAFIDTLKKYTLADVCADQGTLKAHLFEVEDTEVSS